MNLAHEIIQNQRAIDSSGKEVMLDPGYGDQYLGQCLEMQNCIREMQLPIANSLEIGLAYGISAVFICEALSEKNSDFIHHVSDPMQHTEWNGMGLVALHKAGYREKVKLYQDYSYNVLPSLLNNGVKLQFAYIDSTKLFDYLLVDFFFLDKLMDIGGVIIFDDCVFPGIRKLIRFIRLLPNWDLHFQYCRDPYIPPGKYDMISRKLYGLLPRKIRSITEYAMRGELARKNRDKVEFDSDVALGIDYHAIGFRKSGEDPRGYTWYAEF